MFPEYNALGKLSSSDFQPFEYLEMANRSLSNPVEERKGRDMIIRALAERQKFSGYEAILRNLVRKSGLYPYLQSEFQSHTFDEAMLVSLYRSEYAEKFVFHSMQYKIFSMIMSGRNVVLSAPTSMGKSAIIDAVLGSEKFRRIVLVVPTIALIDETRRRVSESVGGKYDVIHHNSQSAKNYKKTIYVLTQERVNERKDIENIDLFVIDEFYKLGFKDPEDERAIALNIALSKLLVNSKQFYMIGPSVDAVRGLSGFSKPYYFVPSTFSTVAVNVHEYNISSNDRATKESTLKEIMTSLDAIGRQTMIYCRSPKSASEISRQLIAMGAGSEIQSEYVDWVKRYYGADWSYSNAISNGIGIHHGTLPRAIQQFTVDLFNSKRISTLICTSTIIEGVNTNAEVVIIHDGKNGQFSLDRFTHNNIKGRAGRMRVHFVGEVHCFEKVPEETVESRVVDVPLGLQDGTSPLNFLAGIQPEHVSRDVEDVFDKYLNEGTLPTWILRKYPTISLGQLKDIYLVLQQKGRSEIREICKPGYPTTECLEILCMSLRKLATKVVNNCALQSNDTDELLTKIRNYLFAKNYQDYMDDFLSWLSGANYDDAAKSGMMDRELKIIRGIFGYSVPKVLAVMQDLLNIVCEERSYPYAANFGLAAAIFENNHLPSNFSALEEMGVPIQTLEKMKDGRLETLDLNVLIRFLRRNLHRFNKATPLERTFLARAVGAKDRSA